MPTQDLSQRYYSDPFGALTDYVAAQRDQQARALAAQQEALLIQEAAQRQQRLQQQPQQPKIDPERMQFGFDRYNAEQQALQQRLSADRQAILQQADQAMMMGNSKAADYIIKTRLENLDKTAAKSLVPFTDTEQFKAVKEFVGSNDLKNRVNTLNMLYNSIKSVDDLTYDDPKFAASLAKTFLTSLVNSAKGTSDAEQSSEFVRRAPELMTFRDWALAKGLSPMNPMAVSQFFDERNVNNPAFKDLVGKFDANPAMYVAKTKKIHDDLAQSYVDTVVPRVIVPTSPEFAEQKLGITPPRFFKDEDARNQRQADELANRMRVEKFEADPQVSGVKSILSKPNISPELRSKAQEALNQLHKNYGFGVQIPQVDQR